MLKLCMLRFDGVGGNFKSYAYAFSMVSVPYGDFYRPFYTSHSLDFRGCLRPPRQNYSQLLDELIYFNSAKISYDTDCSKKN